MEWVLPVVSLAFVAMIRSALKINYFFRCAGHCFCSSQLESVPYCRDHKVTVAATVMCLGKSNYFSY